MFVRCEEMTAVCYANDSLVQELNDLLFGSEVWKGVHLFTVLKILNRGETRDLVAISYSLVHCGVDCCQHTWTLWMEEITLY